MKFFYLISQNHSQISNSNTSDQSIIHNNKQLQSILKFYKQKIDIYDDDQWSFFKKIQNKYEKISLIKSNTICRSYFKIFEILKILHHFHFIHLNNISNSASLCEAPGSFLQSLDDLCPHLQNQFTISLSNKSYKSFPSKSHIHVFQNNNGDLLNQQNITDFIQFCGSHHISFVTCDGGFDCSDNYNLQEDVFISLLCSQIIISLNILASGGTLILKIFDIFNIITLKIIYSLSLCFQSFFISKPFSSRYASSEKYLVFTNFLHSNQSIPHKSTCLFFLQKIFLSFNSLSLHSNLDSKSLNKIFFLKIPTFFLYNIFKFNYFFILNQIKSILQIQHLIDRHLFDNTLSQKQQTAQIILNYQFLQKKKISKWIQIYYS